MIRLVLLLAGIPLLLVGGEGLYHAVRNREPRVMTCDQFVRERPDAAWLKLTSCEVDYIGAGYRESNGRISELLFPVRPDGQPRNVPAVAIVATKDEGALSIAQRTIGGARQPDQEAFLVMMLTIVTALKASREVDGYARVGIVEAFNARRVVSGLAGPIGPSPVVIDLRGRPEPLVPAVEIVAGGLAVLAFILLHVRARRRARRATAGGREAAATNGAPAATETESPPEARRDVLRGLMLLNLPAGAGIAAIETARPLGSRAGVLRKLEAAIPGIHMDDGGRCSLNRPDCTIVLSLGPGDPVATAVLDARGRDALTPIRSLLAVTGWRVYAPKRGVFIDPGQLEDLMEPPR